MNNNNNLSQQLPLISHQQSSIKNQQTSSQTSNTITLPPNASLSTQFGVETRNTVLNAISTLLDNLQNELITYNKAFAIPMNSMTKSIQNYSALQQIQNISSSHLWKSLNSDITNCILINDQMWTDIIKHKMNITNELNSIHQAIQQLHQQKILLIDNPPNFIINTNNNNNNNNNNNSMNNNMPINVPNISANTNAAPNPQFPAFPKIQQQNNNSNTPTTIQGICIQDLNSMNGSNSMPSMPPLSKDNNTNNNGDNNDDDNNQNVNISNGRIQNSDLNGHINLKNGSNGHMKNAPNLANSENQKNSISMSLKQNEHNPSISSKSSKQNELSGINIPQAMQAAINQLLLNNDVSNSSSTVSSSPPNSSSSVNKRKRKRRGYNGPYSEEEQTFMRNWPQNQTPQDILNMSNAMENRFKVKRSPYGLAQKMYQMGIINSRLKAIFQRQLEKENKELSMMEGGGDNVIQSQHPMYNHQNHNLRLDTNQLNNNNHDNHSIHSNSSLNDSDTVCSQDKKKPFTEEEIKFIRNDLIKYDSTEAPRKLYWRFIQNFTDWKNDQKSYLKFYQKFWTLTNENKELLNLPIKKESHSIVHNKPQNGVSNINPLKRKRSIYTVIPKYPNIIPPQKKLKL